MGTLYTISYDLFQPEQNYKGLIAALERLRGVRILLSQWALKSTYTSVQLRDHLRQHLDGNDRLLVTEVDPYNWAGWGAGVDLNRLNAA